MEFLSFRNKVAVVTGAGQGIGFEIARQLAARGASVILNDLDPELAHRAQDQIRGEGGAVTAIPGDSSRLDLIDEMVKKAVEFYGRLDIAVANAGITLFGDFLDFTEESFARLTEVNLRGSFFLAQKAALQMIRQKSPGSILFMSSVTGRQAHRRLEAYGMTKGGLDALAKALVPELAPHRITTNTLAPGATRTERNLSDPDYVKTWERITPLGITCSSRTMADMALFLVSDTAAHITGQCLVVDGGWTSVSPPPTS